MIEYSFKETPISSSNGDKLVAVISGQGNKNLDDILQFMVREGSGMTMPLAKAYIRQYFETVENFLKEGYSVTTPLGNYKLGIKGTFKNRQDRFDSERHNVHVSISNSLHLKQLVKDIKIRKSKHRRQQPSIHFLTLMTQNAQKPTKTASAGSVGILKGVLMKFDKTDKLQGIFLIPTCSSNSDIRIESYITIKSSEILFLFPQSLPKGEYLLEVRSTMRTKNTLFTACLGNSITIQGD